MDMARCLMRFAGSNNTPGSLAILPLFCIISVSERLLQLQFHKCVRVLSRGEPAGKNQRTSASFIHSQHFGRQYLRLQEQA